MDIRPVTRDATFLVAWEVQQPLGSGMLQWCGPVGACARQAFPQAIELNHLQVRPEFRGEGVGSALIHAAEQRAKLEDGRQVGVAVGADNADAQRLYARLGYLRTGVVDTSEYDWVTDDGTVQHEVERNEFLLKRLGDSPPGEHARP